MWSIFYCSIGAWSVQNILLSSTFHKILVSSLTLSLLLWYQFMDFWFSFLAVVSTFVYLLSETAKWAIHIIAAIISDCSKIIKIKSIAILNCSKERWKIYYKRSLRKHWNMGWIAKSNAIVQWKFKSEKWRFGPRWIKLGSCIC